MGVEISIPPGMMNSIAPKDALRWINDRNMLKTPCPAVPWRGPEAGSGHNPGKSIVLI